MLRRVFAAFTTDLLFYHDRFPHIGSLLVLSMTCVSGCFRGRRLCPETAHFSRTHVVYRKWLTVLSKRAACCHRHSRFTYCHVNTPYMSDGIESTSPFSSFSAQTLGGKHVADYLLHILSIRTKQFLATKTCEHLTKPRFSWIRFSKGEGRLPSVRCVFRNP